MTQTVKRVPDDRAAMGDREFTGERAAIERVDEPVTASTLVADLRGLGVDPEATVLVHSSLSALGWVAGGAQAVVDALLEAVTETGTLVMPTHSGQYTDPAGWSNPPVPDAWVDPIREAMPAYRPAVTPTRGMGAIPECFRTYPGVVRSRHPTDSFAARGAEAEAIVADHAFDDGFGEGSPLARLYERDAAVLLLGVGHERNTSLHLAEHRANVPKRRVTNRAPVLDGGRPVHVEYDDIELDDDDFAALGADFARRFDVPTGTVGAATARLVNQRTIVDFAVDWFESNR